MINYTIVSSTDHRHNGFNISLIKETLIEFIATFGHVFIGECGSIFGSRVLSYGLSLCLITAVIPNSHLNPIVSLAYLFLKRITVIKCVHFIITQYLSTFLAILFYNVSKSHDHIFTIVETFMTTFLFMTTVYFLQREDQINKLLFSLLLGLVLIVCLFMFSSSGILPCINPSVDLASHVFNGVPLSLLVLANHFVSFFGSIFASLCLLSIFK